jgi:hypothetical protein
MKSEQIQHLLNDALFTSDALNRLREVSGQLVIDIGRIQALGASATPAQRGHWDNCRIARGPIAKAIYALEAANKHLFTAAVTLKAGADEGESVGDAPPLTHTGAPQQIQPPENNEGEGWKD